MFCRNSLASAVVSPLFTRQACDLLSRKLSAKDQELWNALGGNWIMTSEQWPPGRPIPEYHVEFTDGCIPSNLHNASDCPTNFPTLDTLPREQRGPNYSDAYDGDLPDGEGPGLLINPAVMQAVASKAAMVSTPILPGSGITNRRAVSKFCHGSLSPLPHTHTHTHPILRFLPSWLGWFGWSL